MGALKVVPDAAGRWVRLFDDFEASAQARGLAVRTLEHYSDILRRVRLGFCEREGIEPADVTKRHLEKLAAELLHAGRAVTPSDGVAR